MKLLSLSLIVAAPALAAANTAVKDAIWVRETLGPKVPAMQPFLLVGFTDAPIAIYAQSSERFAKLSKDSLKTSVKALIALYKKTIEDIWKLGPAPTDAKLDECIENLEKFAVIGYIDSPIASYLSSSSYNVKYAKDSFLSSTKALMTSYQGYFTIWKLGEPKEADIIKLAAEADKLLGMAEPAIEPIQPV